MNLEEIEKMKVLIQNEITNKNYDKTAFQHFCVSKKEKGGELNSWSLNELKKVIDEFKHTIEQKKISELENKNKLIESMNNTKEKHEIDDCSNKDFLICPECSSPIEIVSLDESTNTLEFECTKYSHKTNIISLIQYLNNIKLVKLNNLSEFKDKCEIHKNNDYKIYCFDCKRHLCKRCLKSGEHLNHTKNDIEEIEPEQELEIISAIIKERKTELEKLTIDKNIKTKKLTEELKIQKNHENDLLNDSVNLFKNQRNKEIEIKTKEYISDINEIKKKYEKEITERKMEYKKTKNEIKYLYKLKNEKELIKYNLRIEKLNMIYKKKSKIFNLIIKLKKLKV